MKCAKEWEGTGIGGEGNRTATGTHLSEREAGKE